MDHPDTLHRTMRDLALHTHTAITNATTSLEDAIGDGDAIADARVFLCAMENILKGDASWVSPLDYLPPANVHIIAKCVETPILKIVHRRGNSRDEWLYRDGSPANLTFIEWLASGRLHYDLGKLVA